MRLGDLGRRPVILLATAGLLLATLFLLTAASSGVERRVARDGGLVRSIFVTPDFQAPPLRSDRTGAIDLSFLVEDESLPRRSFSVSWEGFWNLAHDGPITFYTRADDHLTVFVDGRRVVTDTLGDGRRTAAHTLNLRPGVHRMRVEYVQLDGISRMVLLWSPVGEPARPLEPWLLFPEEPSIEVLREVRLAAVLRTAERVVWVAFWVMLSAGLFPLAVGAWRALVARGGIARFVRPVRAFARRYVWVGGAVLLVAGAVVAVHASLVRFRGLNPESLWFDDLVWAAIARAETIGQVLSVPAHAPPGFFLALRGMHAIFGDPEWSMQLLPFLAGVMAMPVMGWLAWRVTKSRGLALIAVALTALNPLLGFFTLYVKPYSLDFLVTALLLIASVSVAARGPVVSLRQFGGVALLAAGGLLVSIPSVLLGGPLVNLAALRAWLVRRREAAGMVAIAFAYDVFLLLAFLFLRDRSNDLVRADFRARFLPVSSVGDAWAFLQTRGAALLKAGLPSRPGTDPWDPDLLPWLLPLVGLGMAALFVRRRTRPVAWVLLGFVASALTVSAMRLYPIAGDRTGIFAFPVVIFLCVMGMDALTAWVPWREAIRGAAGLAVAGYALAFPVRPAYWGVNDARLVRHLVGRATPSDGLVLSNAATYLAAVYGPWAVTISGSTVIANGTDARIGRGLTLHLPPDEDAGPMIDDFLAATRPERVWYVAFRTGSGRDALQALEARGYVMSEVERSSRGRLLVGGHTTAGRDAGPPRAHNR